MIDHNNKMEDNKKLQVHNNDQQWPTNHNQRRRSSSFSNLIGQRIVTSYLSTAKQKEEAEIGQKSPQKTRRGWLSPSFGRRLTASKSDDEGVRSMRRMTMALRPSEEGLLMWVSEHEIPSLL